ncbi:MAG TPA: hypothetical protein DIT99_17005, partial [Candidatus Latescibacteria bacterium]|nr:hypothetical protein [Candidatus Latescibacterota bacterium]
MKYTLIPLFSFIILINTSNAQSGANLSLPVVEAAKRIDEITIDGRLEESAWNAAVPTTEFVQREPVEGAEPEEKTEVRILYDNEAIYIGARMYDSDPSRIGRQLVRRDEWGQFDHFTFSVDPNNDKRTGYRFRISAAGAQRDAYLYNDDDQDDAWNAVWESGVQIDALGWTAEMRIPLSQIRYDTSEGP